MEVLAKVRSLAVPPHPADAPSGAPRYSSWAVDSMVRAAICGIGAVFTSAGASGVATGTPV